MPAVYSDTVLATALESVHVSELELEPLPPRCCVLLELVVGPGPVPVPMTVLEPVLVSELE